MAMKKILPACAILIAALLLPVISSCQTLDLPANLGEQFQLPVGRTAGIASDSLTIKFVEVTADSRCPSDVVCVAAGEAKCLLQVKYAGLYSTSVNIIVSGTTDYTMEVLNNFIFRYQLTPYPVSTNPINPRDYVLTLTVTKN